MNRRTEFREVELTWLRPADYNPRVMSDDARARLEKGLEAFGIVDPFIATETGDLLGGHQRLISAQRLGITRGPCIVVHGLSGEEQRALNVLLNNPNAQGQWDMGKLTAILSDLDGFGFDATLTGFTENELAKLLGEPAPEGDGPDLDPGEDRYSEQYGVIVLCGDATEQEATYERLKAEGYQCKVVVT